MADPAQFAIVFSSEKAANMLVAGIPAAVRALGVATQMEPSGEAPKTFAMMVEGGWQPSACCQAEAARLCGGAAWIATDCMVELHHQAARGSDLQYQYSAASPLDAGPARFAREPDTEFAALRAAGRHIIAATGKDGDGIVSRHINRPLSRAITRIALLHPAARPIHATLAAAVIGLAMFAALVWGGATGLLLGAVLFQLASIVDGVDGEMARATFRSSAAGALWDSVTDALTNIGFVCGVSYNLYAAGDFYAATAGAAGAAILALGTLLLARQARRKDGDFTFNGLKDRLNERPSRFRQWLIWLTMRDFYALAACVLVLLGAAAQLLWLFAVVAAAWLMVLLFVSARKSG